MTDSRKPQASNLDRAHGKNYQWASQAVAACAASMCRLLLRPCMTHVLPKAIFMRFSGKKRLQMGVTGVKSRGLRAGVVVAGLPHRRRLRCVRMQASMDALRSRSKPNPAS